MIRMIIFSMFLGCQFSYADNISEENIPLKMSQAQTAQVAPIAGERVALLLGLLVVIAGGAYFLAKKVGRPGQTGQTQIKVLTQHYLGPKKSLAIVRVAGESILIGVTDNSINLIKSLSLMDDEIPEQTPLNFEKSLEAAEKVQTSPNEEFSIRQIKDVVSLKLKGIGRDA
ncbi:MAG: flagellar biosynthetic protein FliO [Bdellovibrionales bacterium]